MKSAIAALQTEIQELRWHIKAMEIEWDLLAASSASPPCSASDELALNLREHVGQAIGAKRRFDYNCIIISLCVAFERYLEDVVMAYVEYVNFIVPSYDDLPKAIKDSHIELTFNLIQKAKQAKHRNLIDVADLVANLHTCLSNQPIYKINLKPFRHHPTNFRAESVDRFFGGVGVQDVTKRLRYFPPFTEYLEQRFPDRDINNINDTEIFYYIDDLVERRNEVSHGSPSQLLRNEMLLEYVDCVDAFCAGIYERLCAEISSFIIFSKKAVEIGKPIVVYNNCIVCIKLSNTEIGLGDTLIADTGNLSRPYIAGEILELQVNRAPMSSVPSSPSVQVGIRVGFKAKENYIFWLVKLPQGQDAVAEDIMDVEDMIDADDMINPEDMIDADDMINPEDMIDADDMMNPEDMIDADDTMSPEDMIDADED
jgi:hypothetical protein